MDTATAQDLNAAMEGVAAASVSASRAPPKFSLTKLAAAAVAGLLLVASIACLILIQLGYPRLQGVVATDLIKPNREQVYTAQLPHPPGWPGLFTFQTDGAEDARASTLQLFEDGVALGPPHAAHAAIAGSGGGYSHWGDVLYFSSTRGDDPRTSGREYRIVAPYAPAPWLVPTLVVLACLSAAALLGLTVGGSIFTILGRFAPPVIYAATVAALVAMAVFTFGDFRQVQSLKPDDVRPLAGHAFTAEIPATASPIPFVAALRAGRDTTSAPFVRLLENGKPVGLPRSRASLIETVGAGRYLVNGSTFVFSTPDNSDPRTNGRTYVVQERLGLSSGFPVVVIVLLAASLLLLARRRRALVIGGLVAACAAGGIAGTLTHFDVITHDEYVSPAKVYHVIDDAYTFVISGNVAPFASAAPVGTPTALGFGDRLVACEDRPQSVSGLAGDGQGACAPRGSGLDVDYVAPQGLGEAATPDFYRYPVRVHPYVITLLFALSAVLALTLWLRPTLRQTVLGAGVLVVGLGGLLTTANLVGLVLPLRAEAPTEPVQGIRADGPRLPYEEGARRLAWNEGDTPESYARRANQVIFESMIHGDVSTELDRWRLEIPVWENWSLHALGAMNPSFKKYRFWSHEKEFERGIGLCGNLSSVLVGYLAENGIAAGIVGIEGHVVVTAEVRPGEWYLFDPDYGVVMPHSLEEVEANPALVEAAYRNATDVGMLGMIVSYYTSSENNSIDRTGRDGFYSGMDGSAEVYREREQFMDLFKWVAPAVMVALGLAMSLAAVLWRGRGRGRRALEQEEVATTHQAALDATSG